MGWFNRQQHFMTYQNSFSGAFGFISFGKSRLIHKNSLKFKGRSDWSIKSVLTEVFIIFFKQTLSMMLQIRDVLQQHQFVTFGAIIFRPSQLRVREKNRRRRRMRREREVTGWRCALSFILLAARNTSVHQHL